MRKLYFLACSLLLSNMFVAHAAARVAMPDDNDAAVSSVRHFYVGGGFDGAIFSTATMQRPGFNNSLGTLRFSLFFNSGVTFNYDLNKKVGLYTGVDIKNVGFIEKIDAITVKHRTYNVGVPIGIKFGNVRSGNYVFAGAGADVPFNYKEKAFESRSDKHKFNEWFSNRTPAFMGYIFAGVSVNPGVTLKVQYYLSNFMNSSYSEMDGGVKVYPYAGYDVHLLMVSLGFNMRYPKHVHFGKKAPEVKTAMND